MAEKEIKLVSKSDKPDNIIARENEISTVRIVLSGLINDLPEESVRERAREMYV